VAAKFQLPVKTTGEFTRTKPDPQFGSESALVESAFQLSNDEPNSDPVQVGDGFCVLHLAGVAAPRPMTAEEARPKIVEAITTQRTREMMSTKAAEIAHNLRESFKANEPAPAAFAKTGVKFDKVPPFSLLDEDVAAATPGASPTPAPEKPADPPDLPRVKQAVAELNAHEVSDFVPTQDGGLIAVVENKMPVDPAQAAEKRKKLDEQYLKGKRSIVFSEWLRDQRRAAGVQEKQQTS
jgi:peptidyl-prolyl cis-trans isomerase D